MHIFTEAGWKQIGVARLEGKQETTVAAERLDRMVVRTYADWAKNHNLMVDAPGRMTVMQHSALSHYIG